VSLCARSALSAGDGGLPAACVYPWCGLDAPCLGFRVLQAMGLLNPIDMVVTGFEGVLKPWAVWGGADDAGSGRVLPTGPS
jgi:hypothetical protein